MNRKTWLGGLALAFCLLAGFAIPAPAQEKASPSNQDSGKTAGTHKKEEVQVTASFPGAANEALGQSVVPPEDLEMPIISGTLLEPLRNQAGIQITGTSLFGSGQAWLHQAYNKFFMKRLHETEKFVSIWRQIKLDGADQYARLVNLGTNPLAAILGPDPSYNPNAPPKAKP
ncbi:hypothetical protein AAU61_05810 [Desulfocarbo indianensis]|nr:hypothetical protein AAU61_05810 [Desulfocarbo indianensis]